MVATCLLDSGIIIDALNGKRGRRELIDRLIQDGAGRCSTEPLPAAESHSFATGYDHRGRRPANDLVLVTGNLKDFPIPELRLYPA